MRRVSTLYDFLHAVCGGNLERAAKSLKVKTETIEAALDAPEPSGVYKMHDGCFKAFIGQEVKDKRTKTKGSNEA